jgi:hypothetical protein
MLSEKSIGYSAIEMPVFPPPKVFFYPLCFSQSIAHSSRLKRDE